MTKRNKAPGAPSNNPIDWWDEQYKDKSSKDTLDMVETHKKAIADYQTWTKDAYRAIWFLERVAYNKKKKEEALAKAV